MKYAYELFSLGDQLEPSHWSALYSAMRTNLGVLGTFTITLSCIDNVLRFYVQTNKDVSTLSNGLEGMLLQPADHQPPNIPKATSGEKYIKFVTGGTLLDVKEKTAINRTKDLQYAVINVRVLGQRKAAVLCKLYFKSKTGSWSQTVKLLHFFPGNLLAVDFAKNTHYLKHTLPAYVDIEKSLFMLSSDRENALFRVHTFPYFSHDYYLHLHDFAFDKHSLIIGATGSGKSKLISLIADRLYATAQRHNYRLVLIDPHASIAPELSHIPNQKVVNFSSESTQLFAGTASDISAATELTTSLLKSIMGEQYTPKVDRLLRFSLFVLYTAQAMSLDTLKRFLTDSELRNKIIAHVSGYVPTNVVQFFGADFNELRTKYYNESISPLIALIDEMQLQPVLVGEGELSLTKTIQEHFLTVFSLNKVSMGERVVKTVAGLLIQQIFLLAQAQAFNEKVILIIDEVSVVQNPALSAILAEARKFNLSVILTQQYFGQISKELRDSIFTNVLNYFVFKVSKEDATMLEGNLNIVLPTEQVKAAHLNGISEVAMRIKLLTELHPRECVVRVVSNGQVVPAIKATTVDAPQAEPSSLSSRHTMVQVKPLPAKFSEQPQPDTPQADIGVIRPPEPFMGKQLADRPAGLFNLSDLLAEHSSSRLKVNKRKDPPK